MPQSGATTSFSAGTNSSAARMRPATVSAVSTSFVPRSMTPTMTLFGARLRRLDGDLRRARARELLEEGIARRLFLHRRRIAEAQVHDRRAADALQRAVDRAHAIARGALGARLEPGFVDLHDVGTGALE